MSALETFIGVEAPKLRRNLRIAIAKWLISQDVGLSALMCFDAQSNIIVANNMNGKKLTVDIDRGDLLRMDQNGALPAR